MYVFDVKQKLLLNIIDQGIHFMLHMVTSITALLTLNAQASTKIMRIEILITFNMSCLCESLLLKVSHAIIYMGLPRCKNLTRFSLFVSFCFAVRYCLKCFCFLCFTSSVSFTGSYTEVKPSTFTRSLNLILPGGGGGHIVPALTLTNYNF